MRGLALVGLAAAAFAVGAAASSAAGPAPWEKAGEVRLALSEAGTELVLGDADAAGARVADARTAVASVLGGRRLAEARQALDLADRAAGDGDERGLAAARASVWSIVLHAAYVEATTAAEAGDVDTARSWLLVRAFRPPTRFSRAAADATLALDALEAGTMRSRAAAAAVRRDLLDTYDGLLRAALDAVRESTRSGFDVRRAEVAAEAFGYWRVLRPAYRSRRGAAAARATDAALADAAADALAGRDPTQAIAIAERRLEGFRAAPLSSEEELRRAGQLERFLKLVPIEYGRGVRDGRVVLDFELQEAITFRDGAAAAFADLEPILLRRNAAVTHRIDAALEGLNGDLAAATGGGAVADPDAVEATTDGALELVAQIAPPAWRDAAKTADFDVIAAALDRLGAAAVAGEWGRAEQARLEAYGIFELGPEQRLRGLAPSLFRDVEGYFWYGTGGMDGLVQLLKRRATPAQIAATRAALDESLTESERRIGAGPGSRASIVTNAAVIVFREGLEAVLILAALMASMVGAQRRHRRPLMGGVVLALVASAITWVVAQTVLGSLAGWGEKLEAVVSLVAIAVLLLILNWFYHRVYWQENLSGLHRRKRRVLAGASVGILSAQAVGLVALGFSSVYREGFETVLFLQALTLEAGAFTVLQGVLLGFAGVVGVFFLVIALERRLPHKKMLVATGLLITWVLVILVGQTVQTLQKVGWVPVTPVEGLETPYWAGLWLGIYPTWQGFLAQAAALAFVVGSYVAAETLRGRRRARILRAPIGLERAGTPSARLPRRDARARAR